MKVTNEQIMERYKKAYLAANGFETQIEKSRNGFFRVFRRGIGNDKGFVYGKHKIIAMSERLEKRAMQGTRILPPNEVLPR